LFWSWEKGIILTYGDFGIAELRLLNKKWLVKQQHKEDDPKFGCFLPKGWPQAWALPHHLALTQME
jgi:hypothetical protein